MQMLQPDGSGPSRPIDVPILIGALGPKGRAIAAKHDGVFAATTVEGLEPGAFDWVAFLYWGTVLDQGESLDSERVRLAAGPGGAIAYHATYELAGADAVLTLPGGKEWLDTVNKRPLDERHRLHCRVQIVLVQLVEEPDVALVPRAAPVVIRAVFPAVQNRLVLPLIIRATERECVLRPDHERRPLAAGIAKRFLQSVELG